MRGRPQGEGPTSTSTSTPTFALAQGSLCESAAALDLAAAIGLVPEAEAAALVGLAVRLKAMLRGLTAGGR